MKKWLSMLLCVALALTCLPLAALPASAASSGDYTYTVLNDDTASITGYSGTAKTLSIPSKVGKYTVTKIGSLAFEQNQTLTSVTIPNTVKIIDMYAFMDCTALKTVVLPNALTTLESRTFYGCEKLERITIPGTVKTVGSGAFMECRSLKEVVIEEGVTAIGGSSFSYCESLASVQLPDGLTEIGSSAFAECRSLEDIHLPDSVNKIGRMAFDFCVSLKEINIPDGVTEINDLAFNACKSLTHVSLPESITTIKNYAFFSCNSLKSIYIPASVTTIGNYVFDDCFSLESIDVAPGNSAYCSIDGALLYKSKSAILYFPYVPRSDSFTIPAEVMDIAPKAINCFRSLSNIYVAPGNTMFSVLDNVLFDYDKVNMYSYLNAKEDTEYRVPDSVKNFHTAFDTCPNLEAIAIPATANSLASNLFDKCESLRTIYFGGDKAAWDKIGKSLKFDGVVHYNTLENHVDDEPTIIDPTCAEDGAVQYLCPCGFSSGDPIPAIGHLFENDVCVNCQSHRDDLVESAHNYANYTDQTWTVYKPNATYLTVQFSSKTKTAVREDYVYIYDAGDRLIGKFDGDKLARRTLYVLGDTVKIRLVCDDYRTDYGFAVTRLNAHTDEPDIHATDFAFAAVDGNGEILNCWSNSSEVIIPNVMWGYPVTRLADSVFEGRNDIKSVTVPESIVSIGDKAFYECNDIKDIFYGGNGVQWNAIEKGKDNDVSLWRPNLHYNTTAPHYNSGVITVEPTCQVHGWIKYTCPCGYTKSEQIPAIDHDFVDDVCRFCHVSNRLSIQKQPQSVVVKKGSYANVSVTANGIDVTYRWYYKDKNATEFVYTSSVVGNTYKIQMTNARAGRQLYCVITDKYGNSVQTDTVTIDQKVYISTQPKTAVVAVGKTAKVSVKAVGSDLTYQWYYKDNGATNYKLTTSFKGDTYSVAMTNARAGRKLYCVITDKYGNRVVSDTVTIDQKVRITTQPKTAVVALGKEAKVTVKAAGSGLTYQWYYKEKGGSKFKLTTSFTGNTYSVAMTKARAGRQIYCVVTDKYGNSVKTNTVTIDQKVRIATQPKSVAVSLGQEAKLTVKAEGSGLTYQWYYKDYGATKFKLTTSFTGNTYAVAMTKARAGRQIYCVITDKYGNSVKTNIVTITKS